MNRKKLLMFGIPLLFVVSLIAAAIYIQIVSVDVDATISEALSVTDVSMSFSGYPGETKTQNIIIDNAADVPLNVELSWVETSNEASFSLDNSDGTCLPYPSDTCEKRVIINEEMPLSNLLTISWDVDVIGGYLPHADVYLDNGETLVFEYAKVDTPCDNVPYPDGELNTFGDKGIVDNDAKAWLSSGVPGYCGLPEFDNNHKSLADWKSEYSSANIVKIEIEVDNWISASNSNVRNIEINGNEIEVEYELIVTSAVIPSGVGNEIPVSFTIDSSSPVGEVIGNINIARV